MVPSTVSRETIETLRVVATFLHSVALVATVFRAVHRWKRGKFFWDDGWAVVAALADSVLLATVWIRAHLRDMAALGHPTPVKVGRGVHMLMSLTFTCVLWSARLSIACSIVRLLPPGRTRKVVFWLMGYFVAMCLLLLIKKSWICGSNKEWHDDCPIGNVVTFEKLGSDIVANVLLVVIPLYMMWNSTLPKGPRWMIRAVFVASITSTAISALHAAYVLSSNRVMEGFTAHFEGAVVVLICNLLVLVTCLYRALRNGRDLDEELSEYISSLTRPRVPLTTMSMTEISANDQSSSYSYARGTSIFLDASPAASVTGSGNASSGTNGSSGLSPLRCPPSAALGRLTSPRECT